MGGVGASYRWGYPLSLNIRKDSVPFLIHSSVDNPAVLEVLQIDLDLDHSAVTKLYYQMPRSTQTCDFGSLGR